MRRSRISVVTIVSGLLLLAGATSANGQSVLLTMQNGVDGGGPFNTTAFSITPNTAPGVSLTQFNLTVGDTQFNFDQIYQSAEGFIGGDGTQSATLLLGDRAQDSVVTDAFTYGFTNLGSGVTFTGQWDIDNDNGDFNADARLVLFNNGAAANAVLTVSFSDGTGFAYTFPDLPSQDTYSIVIPTPGVGALFAAGFMCASARRRR